MKYMLSFIYLFFTFFTFPSYLWMAKWAGLNGRHEARPVLARPKHGLARKSSRPGRHGLIVQAGPGPEVWPVGRHATRPA
jgi:hypothetical protein